MTSRPGAPHTVTVPGGYRVGPWEVREPLASGAFGSVYAARHTAPASQRPPDVPAEVALKFLPTGTRTPRQLRHLQELAEREVEVLRRLRRPRLIRMYDALTVDDPSRAGLDGATVLVLERAEGSLGELLDQARDRTRGRSAARAVALPGGPSLLAQVCEGLAHLHHAGWVHGDLKPANVLLMADGSVRLADFNLAAELEGTHAYAPAFATSDYTPPELLWSEIGERGFQTRPTADIWAFGVLVHLVLTGTLPLPGATPSARRDAALRYARGDDELRLSPELPAAWRQIVTDCLAPGHEERSPHTARALLRRVETAAGAARSPRLPRLRKRRGPHPAVLGAAALAAVSLLGTGALFTLQGDPPGYERCVPGHVCLFSGSDGRGEMCAWYDDDRDLLSGIIVCDFAKRASPKSAFNNGYADDPLHQVVMYEGAHFGNPSRCLRSDERANYGDSKPILSLKWTQRCYPAPDPPMTSEVPPPAPLPQS
ncbi:protein kinase [Streptomyces sp. NPDC058001]|uniref:protein kinase domain-containing protein n=1 Tax=Streptomyces sp. NPDC058001 TaxID=3346300 RepID=UPI0036E8C0FB